MKVLIVSRSFYPMNSPRSFRTTELAKELSRRGHQVKVITPKQPEHEVYADKQKLTIKDMGQPKWQSMTLKGNGINLLVRRAIKRFSKLLFEYPDIELTYLVARSLKKEKGFDLLISIAVPFTVHWGVAIVWNKRKQRENPASIWVADCGDPYMGAENDTFKPPFYFSWVEKWFIRKANYISVPAESAIAAYYSEFHKKIHVIPQGFNFDEIPDCKTKGIVNDEISFAYAGGLIPGKRDPKAFLSYLIKKKQNFKFDIYTGSTHLVEPFALRSDGRIKLCQKLPRKELLQKLCEYDFLVNFENAGKKQIPSKLIDYALLNKPILNVSTSDFDPEALDAFLQRDYRLHYKIENLGDYNIKKVAQKFLELCT